MDIPLFSKKIVVESSGRLGNQLFQLAASKIIKDRLHVDEIYWIGNTDYKKLFEQLINEELFIKKKYLNLNHKNVLHKVIYKLTDSLKINRISEFEDLEKAKLSFPLRSLYLRGYFQDYEIISTFLPTWTNIFKSNYDNGITNFKKAFDLDSAIGIHFRFGDYLQPSWKNEWGNLSTEFYKKGLEKIFSEATIKNAIIFTDDFKSAHKMVKDIPLLDKVSIFSASDICQDLFNELALFGYLENKIISNSTFSWWAGYLSKKESRIVCPKPLTKNEMRESALSPHWIEIPAKWKN